MTISTFNAKRLTGLFLLILVTAGFLMNSMKESEEQKLGRLVESHCAMDGLSKNGCKIKLLLAYLKAKEGWMNGLQARSSNDNAQRRMELATLEKEQEALNSLGDEGNGLITANDMRVLFGHRAHPSTGGDALMGTISMITRDELVAMNAAIEEKRIQLNNIGT